MNRGETLPPGCTIDSEGRPNQDPKTFYVPPVVRSCPSAATRATGLSVFCEIFAGALSGGLTTNPAMRPPTGSSTTCCRSCSMPRRSAARGRFATRSRAWRRGCALRRPIADGSEVLLPGEIERRTRARRERDGVPLDAATRGQIAGSVRPLEIAMPKGFSPS
jgi:uncharacterized oxidoreductase